MRYVSTRKQAPEVSFPEAFANGLAPDGGLYVPAEIPDLSPDLVSGDPEPYPALAVEVLSLFDNDHEASEVFKLADRSYSNFSDMATAPLRQLDENLFVLELFHGPTLSFKDFGLQLVGNLFEDQIRKTQDPINVLGATSGDTGSAAIHGLAGKEGVNVFVLYPKGRISEWQERQMTCTEAKNIYPIPIDGTFDDAQRFVAGILQPVLGADGNIDGLVHFQCNDLIVTGDARRSRDDDPVFGAFFMRLERYAVPRLDHQVFGLKPVSYPESLVPAPRPVHLGMGEHLGPVLVLQGFDKGLDILGPVFRYRQDDITGSDDDNVFQAERRYQGTVGVDEGFFDVLGQHITSQDITVGVLLVDVP